MQILPADGPGWHNFCLPLIFFEGLNVFAEGRIKRVTSFTKEKLQTELTVSFIQIIHMLKPLQHPV